MNNEEQMSILQRIDRLDRTVAQLLSRTVLPLPVFFTDESGRTVAGIEDVNGSIVLSVRKPGESPSLLFKVGEASSGIYMVSPDGLQGVTIEAGVVESTVALGVASEGTGIALITTDRESRLGVSGKDHVHSVQILCGEERALVEVRSEADGICSQISSAPDSGHISLVEGDGKTKIGILSTGKANLLLMRPGGSQSIVVVTPSPDGTDLVSRLTPPPQ